MPLRPGDEPIPGYRLVERLGRGAFGEVWKATAPGGVGVALKFIALGGNDGLKEFRALERVKQIRHANLVSLTGIWVLDQNDQPLDEAALAAWSESVTNRRRKDAEIPTLVQDPREPRPVELVVAMGLGDRDLFSRFKECQAKGLPGIPVDELLDYLEDAAKGIDYLNSSRHDLGSGPVAIQHGDIKPQNIMLVGSSAQVCDFGLARVLTGTFATGSNMGGTPAYIAPECIRKNRPSAATDQYSLAITYVELRTGSLPFAADSYLAVLKAHSMGQLDLSKLSEREYKVIRRATALDHRQRYPSTLQMVRELRLAVNPPPLVAPAAESAKPVAIPAASRAATAPRSSPRPLATPVVGPTPSAPAHDVNAPDGEPVVSTPHAGKPVGGAVREAAIVQVQSAQAGTSDTHAKVSPLHRTPSGPAIAVEPAARAPRRRALAVDSLTGFVVTVNRGVTRLRRLGMNGILGTCGICAALLAITVLAFVIDGIIRGPSEARNPRRSEGMLAGRPSNSGVAKRTDQSATDDKELGKSDKAPADSETARASEPAKAPEVLPSEKQSEESIAQGDAVSTSTTLTKVISNGIGMELVLIPAGEFLMGSPGAEIGRDGDETQHRVRISQPFYLCKTEVTQGQWTQVMGSEPWKGQDYVQSGSEYPAVYVDWDDAAEFCRKLTSSEQTAGRLAAGWSYRLPTEAEWEYACRAETSTRFSFGDDESMLSDYGWWGGLGDDGNAEGEDYAHLVAQKRPNPWGLYDMHGNLWEWCSDWYGDTYYEENLSGVSVDPQGPPSGSRRVDRGGGWRARAVLCRSAYRRRRAPGYRSGGLGFRVALVPSGE